jgi:hypothetical protein
MPRGQEYGHRIRPHGFRDQAVIDVGGQGEARVEQIAMETFHLLGKRHFEDADLDIGLFLAALGDQCGEARMGDAV